LTLSKTTSKLFAVAVPEAQVNRQTSEFCDKLGIDDPISLMDQNTSFGGPSYVTLTDSNITFEGTKNDDEIELSEEDDESNQQTTKMSATVSSSAGTPGRSLLNLPAPKNEVLEDDKPDAKRQIEEDTSKVDDKTSESKDPTPPKKMLKRRNAAIYATDETNDE